MKKTTINVAVAVALSGGLLASGAAGAAVLSIDQGSKTTSVFTAPNGTVYTTVNTFGSWFSMDADGNGTVVSGEVTVIGGLNGLTVDGVTAQGASGSHGGAPGCTFDAAACSVGFVPAVVDDPNTTVDETAAAIPGVNFTEAPDIDNPWLFFSNTGMSFTQTAVGTVSKDDVAGTAELDFSGWRVTWAGIPSINMGGDAVNFDPALNTGVASMSCTATAGGASTACANGAFYVLDYNATVPLGDASGFGGVPYVLHLEGQISGELPPAVPVPAAVWLFGSGLLGLVGVARRRKQA